MTKNNIQILLFVYGSMKKDFINHYRLQKEEFIGNAITTKEYVMYPSDMYLFPYVCENEERNNIIGELYNLINIDIQDVDIFESVPKAYYRKIINIECNNKIYKAFIYFRTSQDYNGMDTSISLKEWTKEFETTGVYNKRFLDSCQRECQEAV